MLPSIVFLMGYIRIIFFKLNIRISSLYILIDSSLQTIQFSVLYTPHDVKSINNNSDFVSLLPYPHHTNPVSVLDVILGPLVAF